MPVNCRNRNAYRSDRSIVNYEDEEVKTKTKTKKEQQTEHFYERNL